MQEARLDLDHIVKDLVDQQERRRPLAVPTEPTRGTIDRMQIPYDAQGQLGFVEGLATVCT